MIGLQQWICKVWGGLRWNHQLQNWCCNGFAVFVNRFRTGPSGWFFTCVLTPFASYFATHYGSRGEKNEHIYCISLGFPSCRGDPKWLVFRQAPKWDCLKSLRSWELHSTTSWFTKINLIDWIWLINIDQYWSMAPIKIFKKAMKIWNDRETEDTPSVSLFAMWHQRRSWKWRNWPNMSQTLLSA